MPKTETKTGPKGWAFIHAIGGNTGKAHYFIDSRALCGGWAFLGNNEVLEDGNHGSPDNCAACRKNLLKRQGKDPDEMDLEFKPMTIMVPGRRYDIPGNDLVLNREKTYTYQPRKKVKDSGKRCTILGINRRKNRSGLLETRVRVQWEGTKAKKIVKAGDLRDLPGKLGLKLAGIELEGEERHKLKRICHVKTVEVGQHVRGEDGKVYEVTSYTPGSAPVEITIEGKPEPVAWFA